MINFDFLPASEAEPINDDVMSMKIDFEFSFTEGIDENNLYIDINKRLNKLETCINTNEMELKLIEAMSGKFLVAIDEKEEVVTRIDWLHRLYNAKKKIGSIITKERADYVRKLIASVQTCPMKNELLNELDSLALKLVRTEIKDEVKHVDEQTLMEKAFKEAGIGFIDLGKVGREYVIREVLNEHGGASNIKHIQEKTLKLEKNVVGLSEVTEIRKIVEGLECLPLAEFSSLSPEKKEKVAEQLISDGTLTGFATLNRTITQFINNSLDVTEYSTLNCKAALTITENDIKGAFKFN